MRRFILYAILVTAVLSACSKDDDNNKESKELDLSGIWYVSSSTPFDVTEETAGSICTYNDDKPDPVKTHTRYVFNKVDNGVYEYKVYYLYYPQPKDMTDEDYCDYVNRISDGEIPSTVLRWWTTKEWNYALITENQITFDLYSKNPIKMEVLRLDDNTISVVNHNLYLTDSEDGIKIDSYMSLSRSNNKVLPLEEYAEIH